MAALGLSSFWGGRPARYRSTCMQAAVQYCRRCTILYMEGANQHGVIHAIHVQYADSSYAAVQQYSKGPTASLCVGAQGTTYVYTVLQYRAVQQHCTQTTGTRKHAGLHRPYDALRMLPQCSTNHTQNHQTARTVRVPDLPTCAAKWRAPSNTLAAPHAVAPATA